VIAFYQKNAKIISDMLQIQNDTPIPHNAPSSQEFEKIGKFNVKIGVFKN
jgi:hypothetical protein